MGLHNYMGLHGATWGYMGLHNHLLDYGTLIATRWAPFHHPKTSSGHGMRTSKAVQTSQNWVNASIFAKSIFIPFHILKIKINHIGFNVGLRGTVTSACRDHAFRFVPAPCTAVAGSAPGAAVYVIHADDVRHTHLLPSYPLGKRPHVQPLPVTHRSWPHVPDGGLGHHVNVHKGIRGSSAVCTTASFKHCALLRPGNGCRTVSTLSLTPRKLAPYPRTYDFVRIAWRSPSAGPPLLAQLPALSWHITLHVGRALIPFELTLVSECRLLAHARTTDLYRTQAP